MKNEALVLTHFHNAMYHLEDIQAVNAHLVLLANQISEHLTVLAQNSDSLQEVLLIVHPDEAHKFVALLSKFSSMRTIIDSALEILKGRNKDESDDLLGAIRTIARPS